MSEACNDPAMAAFIMIFKNIMVVFQVIVPIVLIASAAYSFGSLLMSPDDSDKKMSKVLINKCMAAVIVFFVPFTVNLVVSLAVNALDSGPDKDFSFTTCWNAASQGNGIIQWTPGGQDVTPKDNSTDNSTDDANDG